MDKYIKREDLGEALGAIARLAIDNAETLRTEVTICKGWKGIELRVNVRDEVTFTTLAEGRYVVIGDILTDEYCEAINDALKVKAEAEAKEAEVEQANDEE